MEVQVLSCAPSKKPNKIVRFFTWCAEEDACASSESGLEKVEYIF